jgi:hypothetical protein
MPIERIVVNRRERVLDGRACSVDPGVAGALVR